MAHIYNNLTELVGNTPLLSLSRIKEATGAGAEIVAKIEYFNPGGSVKDRIALAMIEDAEESGRLTPGATIIEPTSGNTGVGIAWIARVMGYNTIIVMPDTMSVERQTLMKAAGATRVLTPGGKGMKGAIEKANELTREIPGSLILGQFTNPANPRKHQETTGQEIWRDTDGRVDIFVAGVGTGGTVTGVGRALKGHNPEVSIVAVEPASSPVLSGGQPGAHKIQGIGAGFVPDNYGPEVVDQVKQVTNEDAFQAARLAAQLEGLLVGISSGAALHAAIALAKEPQNQGKRIVVLLPDTGERYLSTPLYGGE